MKTELETQTDDTGSIRVRLPGVGARQGVHVIVEWEQQVKQGEGWPPGWIERVARSITDETFVEPPDDEFEKRRDFD